MFVELLLVGACMGSLYGLLSMGYAVVHAVTKNINFSHGDIYVSSAYLGLLAATHMSSSLLLSMMFGGLSGALLVGCIERYIFRAIGPERRMAMLIGHIAISMILRSLLSISFGDQLVSIRREFAASASHDILGVPLGEYHIFVVFIAVGSGLLAWGCLYRTRAGMIARAVSEDSEGAVALGFRPQRVSTIVYVLSGAFVGFVAPLGATLTELTPQMGLVLGLKAFVASALGGDNPVAALGAGVLIGIFESLIGGYFGSTYRETFLFVLIVVTLIIAASRRDTPEVRA